MSIKKVGIINYGSSNLYSLQNALSAIGYSSKVINKYNEVKSFDAVFLPGVGSFSVSIKMLKENGFYDEINKFINSGKPFFGICLGFQLLFTKSFEFGVNNGLNIFDGEIVHLKNKINVVPNIGWQKLNFKKKNNFLNSSSFYAYFVHSFYAKLKDQSIENSNVKIDGFTFCTSVMRDNIYATQFHPEKSGLEGLKLIKNFLKKF